VDKTGYGFNILTTAFTTCFMEHSSPWKPFAVKKSPVSLNPQVQYHHVHNCQLLDSVLKHIQPVHIPIPYSFDIRDNTIRSFTWHLHLPSGLFLSGFMIKILWAFLSLLCKLLWTQ
jgi:hypothetical protein